MKTEISSGGLIVRKYRSAWQVLIMKDMSNVWTFPKGKVERGETQRQAAQREIQEEVGLTDLTYVASLPKRKYTYRRNGLVDKTVHYYLFLYAGHKKPVCQKEEGIKAAKWVPVTQALQLIGYPLSNKPLLTKAQEILAHL